MAGALSGTVNVPAVGKLPKAAVAGGLAVVGYLIYRYRSGKSSAAATGPAAAAGTDPYPPDGTTGNPSDLYSTDPATGQTYGDEQAGYGAGGSGGIGAANQLDPYPWDGTTGNAADPYSMDPSSGTTYGNEGNFGGSSVGSQAQNGPPFTTNAAWSQYAINYLTQTLGMDPGTVSAAIGAYIAGRPVTATQQGLINDAIAIAGSPPVSGPNNYPPSINVSGGTGGGGAKPPVPTDLRLQLTRPLEVHATWRPSAHATGYVFQITPKDRAAHPIGDRTDYNAGKLEPDKSYTVHVAATNASGTSGFATSSIKTGR